MSTEFTIIPDQNNNNSDDSDNIDNDWPEVLNERDPIIEKAFELYSEQYKRSTKDLIFAKNVKESFPEFLVHNNKIKNAASNTIDILENDVKAILRMRQIIIMINNKCSIDNIMNVVDIIDSIKETTLKILESIKKIKEEGLDKKETDIFTSLHNIAVTASDNIINIEKDVSNLIK